MSWVKPCKFTIGNRGHPSPCEIMRWYENDMCVMCDGFKAACLGRDLDMYDVRDREGYDERKE